MILRLNGSELADWMEVWCFRCEYDHYFSHANEIGDGCDLVLAYALQEDQIEWESRDPEWSSYLPARVSCKSFTSCTKCPPDDPQAERRNGETRREFHDRIRAETLALPVCD